MAHCGTVSMWFITVQRCQYVLDYGTKMIACGSLRYWDASLWFITVLRCQRVVPYGTNMSACGSLRY